MSELLEMAILVTVRHDMVRTGELLGIRRAGVQERLHGGSPSMSPASSRATQLKLTPNGRE
jgi:hypothetical protein